MYLNTDFELTETMCSAISLWMETVEFDVKIFSLKCQDAINTQNSIGLRHAFAGRLSQEWIKFFNET